MTIKEQVLQFLLDGKKKEMFEWSNTLDSYEKLEFGKVFVEVMNAQMELQQDYSLKNDAILLAETVQFAEDIKLDQEMLGLTMDTVLGILPINYPKIFESLAHRKLFIILHLKQNTKYKIEFESVKNDIVNYEKRYGIYRSYEWDEDNYEIEYD